MFEKLRAGKFVRWLVLTEFNYPVIKQNNLELFCCSQCIYENCTVIADEVQGIPEKLCRFFPGYFLTSEGEAQQGCAANEEKEELYVYGILLRKISVYQWIDVEQHLFNISPNSLFSLFMLSSFVYISMSFEYVMRMVF